MNKTPAKQLKKFSLIELKEKARRARVYALKKMEELVGVLEAFAKQAHCQQDRWNQSLNKAIDSGRPERILKAALMLRMIRRKISRLEREAQDTKSEIAERRILV